MATEPGGIQWTRPGVQIPGGPPPVGFNPNQGCPDEDQTPRVLPEGRDPLAEAQARMQSNMSVPQRQESGDGEGLPPPEVEIVPPLPPLEASLLLEAPRRKEPKNRKKPIRKGPDRKAHLQKTTATTSEDPCLKGTPPATAPMTPKQRREKRRMASTSDTSPRKQQEATSESAPRPTDDVLVLPPGKTRFEFPVEEFESVLSPRDTIVQRVVAFIDRQGTLQSPGIVKVWRDCLSDVGRVVRWTNWDPTLRNRFAARLCAAYTVEAVQSILTRAVKLCPGRGMDHRRGATYVAMALGWNVFVSMDMSEEKRE